MPCPEVDSISSSLTSYDNMRNDLCDYLRRYARQPVHEGMCVCVLENSGGYKNLLYPSSTASCLQRRQAPSLGDLLSSVTGKGVQIKIPLYERVRLAKTLAIAVFQYHATPWLTTSWRSEDVYFFWFRECILNANRSGFSHRLIWMSRSKDQTDNFHGPLPFHRIKLARNTLLFQSRRCLSRNRPFINF